MTPGQVADATAEPIARLAPSESPALPALAARLSQRLRSIASAHNRRSARGVLDSQDAPTHTATPS